jgi:hypothetical protein
LVLLDGVEVPEGAALGAAEGAPVETGDVAAVFGASEGPPEQDPSAIAAVARATAAVRAVRDETGLSKQKLLARIEAWQGQSLFLRHRAPRLAAPLSKWGDPGRLGYVAASRPHARREKRRQSAKERSPMQYMYLIYSDEKWWATASDAEREAGMAAYLAYTKALIDAGVYESGAPLQPTTTATRVRVSADGKSSVLDGPYVETKEQLGGYYLVNVANLDEAIAWAARCPGASHGTIEVRPIMEVPAPV